MHRFYLISALSVIGLTCGMVGKRVACAWEPAPEEQTERAGLHPVDETAPRLLKSTASTSRAQSEDTVASLLSLPERELYGRLAAWSLDADEAELSDFLKRYGELGHTDYEVRRLVFVHLTRLDPLGAVESATDDRARYLAWSAWACHDPEAALAADAEREAAMTSAICRVIGEFHPDWLLANFDRIPERFRKRAFDGFRQWPLALSNPDRMLERAAQWNDQELLEAIFYAVAHRSLFEAWRWSQEYEPQHPESPGIRISMTDLLVEWPDSSKIDDLERIAEDLPAGELKRDVESRVMEFLMETDPEAALARARATDGVRTRAEYLAIAGKAFVYADPQRALEVADELFATCPGLFDRSRVEFADGTSETIGGERLYKIWGFLQGLAVREPDGLMTAYLAHDPSMESIKTFRSLSNMWADHAPDSFVNWLETQTDPRIREPAVRVLVKHFSDHDFHAKAADWSLSLGDAAEKTTLRVFRKWKRFDPDAAGGWLENADLPDERKSQLREGGAR